MKKSLFCVLALFCSMAIFAKNVTVTIRPAAAKVVGKEGVVGNSGEEGVYSIPVGLFDKVYTVSLDGFDPVQFTISLKSSASMNINLIPNRKNVHIVTEPEDASIKVDGTECGNGQFQIRKNESKSLKITADGYDTYYGTVNFNDQRDINMTYNVALVPNIKKVTVMVDVESADFYLDGVECGKGKSADIILHKGKVSKLLVRATGYLDCVQTLDFGMEGNSLNLTNKLTKDESYTMSEDGAQYANKSMEIKLRTADRINVLQRINYSLMQAGFTMEKQDHVLGFYQTVWNLDKFTSRNVRTRVSVTQIPDMEGDGTTKYNILIECQESAPNTTDEENFKKWNRILKKYGDLARDLQRLQNLK